MIAVEIVLLLVVCARVSMRFIMRRKGGILNVASVPTFCFCLCMGEMLALPKAPGLTTRRSLHFQFRMRVLTALSAPCPQAPQPHTLPAWGGNYRLGKA